MARSQTENIDIELFQNDFQYIDQEFLQSVVSIFSFYFGELKQFLLMTKDATYAYGVVICSCLSLTHDYDKPQRISRLNYKKIVQVDSGFDFVAILTHEGQVFVANNVGWKANETSEWKTNKSLRLISNYNDRFKMIACGGEHLLLLREDGHVFAMGSNRLGQITGNEKSSYEIMIHIDNLKNVKLIACGLFHNLSLTNNGEIYSWGTNHHGELGLGDENSRNTPCLVTFLNDNSIRIKDIAAGQYHSLFLFENGQLCGCGRNYHGELGFGGKNRSKLTKIPIENVQQIACSTFHNFSLAYDGSSYYAWGEIENWSSPKKLDYHPTSFASASTRVLSSPITFGLTSTIHALKCCLKSASEYYRRMFSGNWSENDQVTINDYSYETYYAYLLMLHTSEIHINHQNITELVDLANCYGDIKLMKHCKTFIWNDLDEQTMTTYLPLIIKYEMKELYDKLSQIAIEQVLPKVTDNIRKNNENSIEFLNWYNHSTTHSK
ncbi:RCC1 and BTB domain-containing protein 2-like [Dermatophagoides farinae]|uniref:RCC1 and BTB domain-containing protein 2-like n=1 Tax=Dermatophagoides farinae TaxID=6954 RepID=UPI003F61281D